MLEFELPLAFGLLLLPLVVNRLAPEFRDQGEAVRVPFFGRLVELTGRAPAPGAVVLRKGPVQRVAVVAIWILLVAALARPAWVGEPIVQEESARDLLLVVDLSGSMQTEDFVDASGEKMSRLAAVKQVLDDFIERRGSDRLGLAVFGSAAFLQAPFTDDHESLRALLAELRPRMAGPQTMIGDAIGLALRHFEASGKENRVAILLTDGNDTGSQMPVSQAADIAASRGIHIHTIAMGDPTTAGEEALDLTGLRNISDTTDGRFFLALERDELADIYDELDRVEPEALETLSFHPKLPLYPVPLGVALMTMLTLAGVFTVRGRA